MVMKSLSQLRSIIKQPQQMHKWFVDVPSWPNAVSPASSDVIFLVMTSTIPESEYEYADIGLGGYKFKMNPKINRQGEISWKFTENTAGDVSQYFLIDYPNACQNWSSLDSISLTASDESDLIAPLINMSLLAADAVTVTKKIQLINTKFEATSFGGEFGQESAVQQPEVKCIYDGWVLLNLYS